MGISRSADWVCHTENGSIKDDLSPQDLMLGTFQQSNLRIEVNASESLIRDVLTRPKHLHTWMWPQTFSDVAVEVLGTGDLFTSWLGPIAIDHRVASSTSTGLHLLLSRGIDGFHAWHWGEGWVQSNLEGVSLLPLNLGQSFGLLRLKDYLTHIHSSSTPS